MPRTSYFFPIDRAIGVGIPGATIGVIVPSYRRPEALRRCLAALAEQSQAPIHVVVGLSADDAESRAVVESYDARLPIEAVHVADRRIVPLMQAAVDVVRGDVIASTDDDAEPAPDWLSGLLDGFADGVGGVGGRDLLEGESARAASAETVGMVQWFGRVIYNHHAGTGPAREVDVLKGVNMSLRRELWGFDAALRGRGDQPHWELDLCLRARRLGWRLVYDPGIVVRHGSAARVEDRPRSSLAFGAVLDDVHNEAYAVLKWSSWPRRLVASLYGFGVGHRKAPGPLLLVERAVREPSLGVLLTRAVAGAAGRALALTNLLGFLLRRPRLERRRPR